MADPRYYFKVDVGYFDNPKVADLLDESPRAAIAHLRAIAYCRQHITDGVFPIRQVMRLASASHCGGQCDSECDFCAVVNAGLFVVVDSRTARVHDYLEHQESPEAIQRRKNAGKAGAAARWGGQKDASKGMRVAYESQSESRASRYAEERRGEDMYVVARDSSSADADATDESRNLTLLEPPTSGDRFDEFYDLFAGRKKSPAKAKSAWTKALSKKGVTADLLIERGSAYVTAMKATDKFPQFTKYPENWLNDEMWEGDLPQPTQQQRMQRNPNIPEGW